MPNLRQLFSGFKKTPKEAVAEPVPHPKSTQTVYYTVSKDGELIALNTQEVESVKVAAEGAQRDLREHLH